MKKAYMSPCLTVQGIKVESFVANSVQINKGGGEGNEINQETDFLGREENWSGTMDNEW